MEHKAERLDIRLVDGQIDASSYVDPQGFIIRWDNRVFRAVYDQKADFYRHLIKDGTVQHLHERYGLVQTKITELSLPERNCKLVLEHEVIKPATYCVEWCPSMLRDAARLHIELSLELASREMMLQDAYPWNVRFQGTRSVFIDFTSIVPADDLLIWPAYGQFQSFFLWPLELAREGKGKIARALMFDNIDGVLFHDFMRNTAMLYRLKRPGMILRWLADRLVQRKHSIKRAVRKAVRKYPRPITPALRERFFMSLLESVERLNFKTGGDIWIDYYEQIESSVDKNKKLNIVDKVLERISPPTVLDLGCNAGVFSVLAARRGASVVSIDQSEPCIDRLYQYAKQEELEIHPLVANIVCPTPGFGFMGNQYSPLIERIRAHTVLCLGLMHHLHVGGRQPLDRIVQLLRHLTSKYLIFEYIDRADANIDLIGFGREMDYDFTAVHTAILRYFKSCETYESDRVTRRILLCKADD